jgi:DNA (cytosine-5)-methyltransferase 1
MSRPLAVDWFAGEAGAGTGYDRAGFDVVAVDNRPAAHKRNPYPMFVGDALVAMGDLLAGHRVPFVHPSTGAVRHVHRSDIALNHGSPPCTGYSRGTIALPDRLERYDRLIAVTREAFLEFGVPYVIENVEDAAPELRHPLMLCGSEFGLGATDRGRHPARAQTSPSVRIVGVPCRSRWVPRPRTTAAGPGGRRVRRSPPQ